MGSSLINAMNISRHDIQARLTDLDVISNNLANINTNGFKSSRTDFQEMLNAAQQDGVYVAGTPAQMTQGTIRPTSSTLDWAIEGEGFFQVKLPNGQTAYTRDGELKLDANRQLVTASGYPLVWTGQIPQDYTAIAIRQDGSVQVTRADGTVANAGTVALARFANPTGLVSNGTNIWLPTPASGLARTGAPGSAGFGVVHGSSLEASNVNMARDMTALMTDQRNFQFSLQVLQQTDQMIAQAINLRKG
jgi:flagellar basal-body rod protein FlgG